MFSQDMANIIIFRKNVSIWDLGENEKVKIGFGTCKDPSPISIYVV
jgi:hypothetical protein